MRRTRLYNMGMNSASNVTMQNNRTETEDEETWSKILVASTMTPIIVLGCVGNILSLLVWVKIRRCKTSTACFLACLAIADLVALFTGLNFWMAYVVKIDLRFTSRFSCKFLVYLDFASQYASAWIVVLVTVERAVAACFPFKYKIIRRPEVALGVTLGTVIMMLCVCLVFLISADIVSVPTHGNSTMDVCLFTDDSSLVQAEVAWFYAELVIHFVIPFVIIVICNVCILVKMVLLAVKRLRTFTGKQRCKNNDNGILRSIPYRAVLLSIAFCVGVGPIHIYGYKETLQFKLPIEVEMSGQRNDGVDSVYITFVILMYLNNAINFLLYCAVGSGFRKDIVKIFRQKTKSPSTT